MAYRDEELAADARIARLEAELGALSPPESDAGVLRECEELEARRDALDATRRELRGTPVVGAPARVYVGATLSGLGLLGALMASVEPRVFFFFLPLSLAGVALVLHALFTKWREGRGA